MMEMPFHLRALPPEALDVLRFYRANPDSQFEVPAILNATGLSERGFGKAVRRLVTKKYLQMVSEGVYRLSDPGRGTVRDLAAWDDLAPQMKAAEREPRFVTRRLVLALPRMLLSGQPTSIYVGFDEPSDDDVLREPVNLLVRLVVINGDDENVTENAFRLTNATARQRFEITAGRYSRIRVRVQVCQLSDADPEGLDLNREDCAGMYVDVPVTLDFDQVDGGLTAYGSEIFIREA